MVLRVAGTATKVQQTKMLVTCQSFGDLFLFDSEKYNKGRFKVMDTYLQLSYNFEPTFLHLPCFEERAKFL